MKVRGTHLEMIRGDSEAIRVSLEDAKGNAIPLQEGDKITLTVKTSAATDRIEFQKVVKDFEGGEARITIRPKDTKNMMFKMYYYDIQLDRADGDVKTVVPMSGFTIAEEITND